MNVSGRASAQGPTCRDSKHEKSEGVKRLIPRVRSLTAKWPCRSREDRGIRCTFDVQLVAAFRPSSSGHGTDLDTIRAP